MGQFATPASGEHVTILDTNVLSEMMASTPSQRALTWISERRQLDKICLTSITVAEILYGIELLPSGKRRARLDEEANAMFDEDFLKQILVFDEHAAKSFARIAALRRRIGRPIAELDAQIAAIASIHGATLATRNTADFENCGIRLVNPWLD